MADTRFRVGNPGGPGRPKGARAKLGETFIQVLLDDFLVHGAEAVAKVRLKKADAYLAVLARLMPQHFKLEVHHAVDEFLAGLRSGGGECMGAAAPDVADVAGEPPALRH